MNQTIVFLFTSIETFGINLHYHSYKIILFATAYVIIPK